MTALSQPDPYVRDTPEWDTDMFIVGARKVIKKRVADLLGDLAQEDRRALIEDEALSLAYYLAETAADRCDELRFEHKTRLKRGTC